MLIKNRITLACITLIAISICHSVLAMEYDFLDERAKAGEWTSERYGNPLDPSEFAQRRTLFADKIKNEEATTFLLSLTLYHDDYHFLELFLEHGLDPNKEVWDFDEMRYKPLLFHVKKVGLAKLLIRHGANVSKQHETDGSLIHNACNPKYPPRLLKFYANLPELNVNAPKSGSKCTPLHTWAHSTGLDYVNKDGTYDQAERVSFARKKLRILIRAGANILAISDEGKLVSTEIDAARDEALPLCAVYHREKVKHAYDKLSHKLFLALEAVLCPGSCCSSGESEI